MLKLFSNLEFYKNFKRRFQKSDIKSCTYMVGDLWHVPDNWVAGGRDGHGELVRQGPAGAHHGHLELAYFSWEYTW